MREREQLSTWEKDYISSRLTGWKVVSFFLPGLWQMWSKRWWLFRWWMCITLWLGLLWYATWDSEAMNWAGRISWLINVILTLIKFTEKAYQHDKPYFQRYLDEYAELNWWANRKQKKINQYEDGKQKEQMEKETANTDNKDVKYDKYGFDREGYNREWFDAYGFDREGFNREWYNEEWFDKFWFDKNGYNYKWFDKNWYDKNWYNKNGEKKNGAKKVIAKKNTTRKANTK